MRRITWVEMTDNPIRYFTKLNETYFLIQAHQAESTIEFIRLLFAFRMNPTNNVIESDGNMAETLMALTGKGKTIIYQSLRRLKQQGFCEKLSSSRYRVNSQAANKQGPFTKLKDQDLSLKINKNERELGEVIDSLFPVFHKTPRRNIKKGDMSVEAAMKLIEILQDQLKVKDHQIAMMFDRLSPEQKQEVKRHLTLVKED